MARTKKIIGTTIDEIISYWYGRVDEADLGVDWSEARERCWRCGYKRTLQRCHIIPSQLPFSGSDTASNYVLLCASCHAEAPSCPNPSFIWSWIKRTKVPCYDMYWGLRSLDNLKSMYGLDVLHEMSRRNPKKCTELYGKIIEEFAGVHACSAHQISDATRLYAYERVFKEIPTERNHCLTSIASSTGSPV